MTRPTNPSQTPKEIKQSQLLPHLGRIWGFWLLKSFWVNLQPHCKLPQHLKDSITQLPNNRSLTESGEKNASVGSSLFCDHQSWSLKYQAVLPKVRTQKHGCIKTEKATLPLSLVHCCTLSLGAEMIITETQISISLLLSEFAYKALAWLTRPFLGS